MTRKDYIKLAEAFSESYLRSVLEADNHYDRLAVWQTCRNEVMLVLKADNPNFDEDRFKAACFMETVNEASQ